MTKGTIYQKIIYQQCFLNAVHASSLEVNFDVLIFYLYGKIMVVLLRKFIFLKNW